jgi:hypothetical protein
MMMMAVTSTPSIMMTTPAHMAVAVAVTVAASDLDDRFIGAAESSWRCSGHCRGRQGWR